jgi:hypothetical protein
MIAAPEPWEVLADTLLQREALLCRLGEGVPPRDFAGMYISVEEVDRILRTLPGLDGPSPELAVPLQYQLSREVGRRRELFTASLADSSRFAGLARSARLDRYEAEVLALVAAIDLHPQRQRLMSYVQDNVQLPRVTLAVLHRIFSEDGLGAHGVAPDSGLRRAELVEVDGSGPWATRMCALPSRLAWHLRGDQSLDPDLPPGVRVTPSNGSAASSGPGVVVVHGADRESRLRVVDGRWPLRGRLVTPAPATPTAWAAVVREATLGDLIVVLELDALPDADGRAQIDRAGHLTFVLSSQRELPLELLPDRPWTELTVASGDAAGEDWERALGIAPDPRYRLNRDQLRLVSVATKGDPDLLGPGVRRLAGGHLDRLALRVSPRRNWDDLILAHDQKEQLRELAARHRRRGVVFGEWGFPAFPSSGIVALLSGPSGTGKTLAAEVVAGDLGLDLYKVDLSLVVSKYIGETEKNLSVIFDAAAAGDLVLFFDEADALFGRRSEVSDAHDRYANIEVAYLLQRLESYEGLVMLATNLQGNIDPAFLRRISVSVEFAIPDERQRHAIWQQSFPGSAPARDLDLEFLAHNFKITGGVIRNATLGAAFLAAEARMAITMEHVALALKREFQKLGRLRTEAEFDRYFDLVNRDEDVASAR